MDPREPYDLYAPTREPGPKNFYRLAGSPTGTGGSSGSLDLANPESLQEFAAEVPRTHRASAGTRRSNRRVRGGAVPSRGRPPPHRTEASGAVRRRERIGAEDRHRANRPVKVEVDPARPEVVKRDAVRHRLTVGQWSASSCAGLHTPASGLDERLHVMLSAASPASLSTIGRGRNSGCSPLTRRC